MNLQPLKPERIDKKNKSGYADSTSIYVFWKAL